ncbi:MAG TPA: hypothetical protein VEK57_23720 [Thermoanaerobaculia bacterium]|nr:hypothetical protein [Thermoanaerobaculia bacterium]
MERLVRFEAAFLPPAGQGGTSPLVYVNRSELRAVGDSGRDLLRIAGSGVVADFVHAQDRIIILGDAISLWHMPALEPLRARAGPPARSQSSESDDGGYLLNPQSSILNPQSSKSVPA